MEIPCLFFRKGNVVLEVDLHVHSLFSRCGLHTILELLEHACSLGMKGIAITDHGLTVGGRLNSVFFERFVSPFPEVEVFKGVECNLLDTEGAIDFPVKYRKYVDIALLGIHPNTEKGGDEGLYTDMLLKAIDRNPYLDIITHPNDPNYPVDFEELARFAAERDVALELNNSKIRYARSSVDEVKRLMAACVKYSCPVVVNSDTHAIHELGDDGSIRPAIEEVGFPEKLIVNRTPGQALSFIAKCRARKPFRV